MRILGQFVLFVVCAVAAAAQSAHEKILIPVFFSGPGAHGSEWWTTVSVYAQPDGDGTTPLIFSRAVLEGDPECLAVCGCGGSAEVEAGAVKNVCILNANPTGLLLYREKNGADAHFSARVADLSRSVETAGTELKIVREHELRRANIVFPSVPIGPGYRVGLRLFDTSNTSNPEVVLRIHGHTSQGTPIVEETIPLNVSPDVADPRPAHPSFAMIGDLAARYPQLKGHGLVLIELLLPEADISPVPKPSYWAVVTITNNVTQQVTMVTPQ